MIERDPKDDPNRVPAALVEGAVVWTIPVITETGNLVEAVKNRDGSFDPDGEQSEDIEPQVILPTAQEVEKITQDAYQEGLKKGLQEGLLKGQEEGYQQGYEKAQPEGLKEGKAEGLQLGIQQGIEQYKTQVRQKLTELNQLLTTLTHLINSEDYQLEQALLNIIKTIAEIVIKREVSIDSKEIIQVIREAIVELPKGYANVRVFVSENNLPLVKEAAQYGGENWQITLDENITNGGCRIETPYSIVDYTIEARFKEVLENVFNKSFADGEETEFEDAPGVVLSIDEKVDEDKIIDNDQQHMDQNNEAT